MASALDIRREAGLCAKFTAVSCLGFLTDLVVLKIALALGLSPAAARSVSLIIAMQVTFCVNGFLVFRCLDAHRFTRQWASYMGSNGFGNLFNYAIFLALIDSRLPIASDKLVALAIGSLTAWVINFLGARIFTFGEKGLLTALVNRARGRVCTPCAEASEDAAAEPPAGAVPSAVARGR